MVGERVPWRTTWPSHRMSIVCASREAVHPTLHSWLMDRRAPAGKLGKICPRQALMGKVGRSRRQLCVEVTVLPSGMVTVMRDADISRLVWDFSIDI